VLKFVAANPETDAEIVAVRVSLQKGQAQGLLGDQGQAVDEVGAAWEVLLGGSRGGSRGLNGVARLHSAQSTRSRGSLAPSAQSSR
jgi:hypothetical protein